MTDADKAYQIAEDRIERAKRSGARVLSLSPHYAGDGRTSFEITPDLGALDRIPQAVSELTNLQALHLADTQVSDLSSLAILARIRTLTLNGTKAEDNDLSHLAALIRMQTLYLSNTKIADISALARMTGMRVLLLRGTAVKNITNLAELTAMRTLDLSSTLVEDLSGLAKMTKMEELNLSKTKVKDISPLKNLIKLRALYLIGTATQLEKLVAEDAPWATDDLALNELGFEGTRSELQNGLLENLADFRKDHRYRTKIALAALRENRHWREVEGSQIDPPDAPEPSEGAIAFGLDADGKVLLAETTAPLDDPAQEELKQDLLRAARELAAYLEDDNQFGALAQDAAGYAALLARPAQEIAPKALWPLDVRLRNALAADQAADQAGRLNEMLPPLVRSALEGVVAIGAPWLQDHPGYQALVEALKRHVADETEEAEAEVSADLVDALEQPKLAENIDEATLAIGQAARRAAFDPGPIGRQSMAKKSLLDYVRGFTVYLLNAPLKAMKWGDGAFVWKPHGPLALWSQGSCCLGLRIL